MCQFEAAFPWETQVATLPQVRTAFWSELKTFSSRSFRPDLDGRVVRVTENGRGPWEHGESPQCRCALIANDLREFARRNGGERHGTCTNSRLMIASPLLGKENPCQPSCSLERRRLSQFGSSRCARVCRLPRVGVEVAGTPLGVAGAMQPQAMQAAEAMQEEAPR